MYLFHSLYILYSFFLFPCWYEGIFSEIYTFVFRNENKDRLTDQFPVVTEAHLYKLFRQQLDKNNRCIWQKKKIRNFVVFRLIYRFIKTPLRTVASSSVGERKIRSIFHHCCYYYYYYYMVSQNSVTYFLECIAV